jgi:hypothetical protein
LPDEFRVLKIAVGKQVNLVDGFHPQALWICGRAPARQILCPRIRCGVI